MAYANPSSMDVSSLAGPFIYLNSVTHGWFINCVIMGIYAITLFGYYKARDEFGEAMAVSGYFCLVVSILFWIGNIANGITLTITIALSMIGTLVLLITK